MVSSEKAQTIVWAFSDLFEIVDFKDFLFGFVENDLHF